MLLALHALWQLLDLFLPIFIQRARAVYDLGEIEVESGESTELSSDILSRVTTQFLIPKK